MEVPEEQSREKAEPRHHSERLVQSVHTHTVQKLVGRPARARLPEFSELLHFEKNRVILRRDLQKQNLFLSQWTQVDLLTSQSEQQVLGVCVCP